MLDSFKLCTRKNTSEVLPKTILHTYILISLQRMSPYFSNIFFSLPFSQATEYVFGTFGSFSADTVYVLSTICKRFFGPKHC